MKNFLRAWAVGLLIVGSVAVLMFTLQAALDGIDSRSWAAVIAVTLSGTAAAGGLLYQGFRLLIALLDSIQFGDFPDE